MKNKTIRIIISITTIILLIGNIYFFLQMKERDRIIDKLEDEVKEKKEDINTSKENIDELEYQIEYYEDMYGKYEVEKEDENITDYSNIEELTYSDFENKLNDKESFIILISQTYCSHCIDYKPKYNQVLKKNKIIGYEIDLLTLTEEEYEKIMELTDVTGTPTTLFYNNGIEIEDSRLVGSKSKEELTTALIEYNFIK